MNRIENRVERHFGVDDKNQVSGGRLNQTKKSRRLLGLVFQTQSENSKFDSGQPPSK